MEHSAPKFDSPISQKQLVEYVARVANDLTTELAAAQAASRDWTQAEAESLVSQAMQRCLARLAATEIWGQANRLPSSRLWKTAECWLQRGWLQTHARSKPHGYAGDFQMLEAIQRGFICQDPLGRWFDHFFQQQSAPRAVRERTRIICECLLQQARSSAANEPRIVGVGSGPATEIHDAAQQLTLDQRRRFTTTLLDLDQRALDAAANRLSTLLPPDRLFSHRLNLFRLATRPALCELLQRADFLYCAGLFDYLDDAAAATMLGAFWRALRPGGRALVFNFSTRNDSRAYMEWIANWYLIYRTAEQMRDVARRAEIPSDCVEIRREPTGASLYWCIRSRPRS